MDRELTRRDRLTERLSRWVRPALLALAAGIALIWLGGALRPGVELSKLRVATAERSNLEAILRAAGVVQPAAEQVMSSPVDARLLEVLRPAGSVVKPGDALLRLDLSATELTLGQLEGRLEQARSKRVERQLLLEKELTDLRNRYSITQLELEESRFRLEQQQRLHHAGLISSADLRSLETRVKRQEIELEGLREGQVNAEASATAQLQGLDAEVESLQGERVQLTQVLERATTRADRAGVVTWSLDEEGAMIRQGDPIARLADLGSFRVEASASDVHASRLGAGQAVRLPLDDATLAGRIDRILPAVEQGTVRFWVELETPDHPSLRPNLRLDVLVVTATRADAVTLSHGPFASGPGTYEVFVVDDPRESAQRRRIHLGLAGHRRWEVTEGLEPGERVIVSDLSHFQHMETLKLR